MIALLAPAKRMDFDSPPGTDRYTVPPFLEDAADLVTAAVALDHGRLKSLMGISAELAELTAARFRGWRRSSHDSPSETKQAIFAYRGEVYRGLDADSMDEDDLVFAQSHIRILSGLYGILRPLDLILPYRLEMATRLANDRGRTLYDFWGGEIAQFLRKELVPDQGARAETPHRQNGIEDPIASADVGAVLVDLASREYMQAVARDDLDLPVITPVFRDFRNGRMRTVAMYAKRQRGAMARYLITQRLTDPEGLKAYTQDGYRYDPDLSTECEWVFVR